MRPRSRISEKHVDLGTSDPKSRFLLLHNRTTPQLLLKEKGAGCNLLLGPKGLIVPEVDVLTGPGKRHHQKETVPTATTLIAKLQQYATLLISYSTEEPYWS